MSFQLESPIESASADEAHAQVVELHDPVEAPRDDSIRSEIEQAASRIAPLWSLRNFVAVNPFMGFSDSTYANAVHQIDQLLHGEVTMSSAFYRAQYEQGRIAHPNVLAALGDAPRMLERTELAEIATDDLLEALLADGQAAGGASLRVETVAEAVDRVGNTEFATLAEREIARWCSGRFDLGESAWAQPDRDRPLFEAWRSHATIDPSPELLGLSGFRDYVRDLPHDPVEVIAKVLLQIGVPHEQRVPFMTRALATIAGWAGYARRLDHEARLVGHVDDTIVHLLAMRIAFDGAIDRMAPDQLRLRRAGHLTASDAPSGLLSDAGRRIVWQHAYELGYQHALLGRLTAGPGRETTTERPDLQAVFCIDVRSEVLRRHLEAQSPGIRTIGFAGFFGFALEHVGVGQTSGSARCPVLLSPAARVCSEGSHNDEKRLVGERDSAAWLSSLRKLSVLAYPFVETLGLGFAGRLISDSLGWTRPGAREVDSSFAPRLDASHDHESGLTLDMQIDLAEGALRNMGLVRDFARVVLICGHGSTSTNNPYASGLDCGACGGHRGDVNARVAAAALQSPDVRAGLAERGIDIPDDTVFIAGLHDTTCDTVEFFDAPSIDPKLSARIQQWIDDATAATRCERAPDLGERAQGNLAKRIQGRSRDWSEVRPEWGLAGNAAFIAAPRAWTTGTDLGGRTFLHDYQASDDAEGSVLELIMTAPLVVASWINLQYFASTTDNVTFGSGHKALHNVVGRHGVQLGNASDLQVGLPWQSVHDGERYLHEPLKLTAIIAAAPDDLDAVLARHEHVRELVENGWIHLMAWTSAEAPLLRRTAEPGVWVEA